MSKNIEIEAKAMIDKSGYETLINSYEHPGNTRYRQDNYYIDTIDFKIHKCGLGMRIRNKSNGDIEMTLKVKQKEGKLEINQDLNIDEFNASLMGNFPNGEILDYLKDNSQVDIDKLHIFALLTTHRLDVKYKDSLISIDESHYNNIVDYEVECEASSMRKAKKNLKEFLDLKSIPFSYNKISKLKRVKNSLNINRN